MLPSFRGLINEDPFEHVENFLNICDTMHITSVTEEAIRLSDFPFSLKDKAYHWLKTLGTPIATWNELRQIFLRKFFPIGRTNALRNV